MILNKSNLRNTKTWFFCHAHQHLFSATCAVTVVPHMHFCVSKFKQHWLFWYIITLLIVLLVYMNDFVLYQHFIFSEFNLLWMFSKQFIPIVITLQVLHIIFKHCYSMIFFNQLLTLLKSHFDISFTCFIRFQMKED